MSVRQSPAFAASLSFLVPGLGQVWLGAVRRGLLIAIPAVCILVAAAGLWLAGRGAVLDALVREDVLVGLLVLNLAMALYHVVAIVDAYGRATHARLDRRVAGRASVVVLTAVLVLTFTVHGVLEAVGYETYATLGGVFVPAEPGTGWSIPETSFELSPSPSVAPSPTPSPSASVVPSGSPVVVPSPSLSPSPSPKPSPSAAPRWAADGRLNLLLIGSDAGPDRWSLRTDTIVVLSVDVKSGRAALFGIPRNMVGVPLPPESAGAFDNGRFPGMLNALYVYAMGHPRSFPGGDARGFRAVTGAVQELVGVRLDAVVVVNLAGFVRLVNAMGGLWINVPERLVDENYPLEDGSGSIRLDIKAGCQRLNGRMALAYARSRHQDSDYGRMRRQQAVLVALQRQVDPIALLSKVPELLAIAKNDLWTTIRRADVRGIAELAARVDTSRIRGALFVPSRYPSHLDTAEINRIRQVVRAVFDGGGTGSSVAPVRPGAACP